MKPDCPPVQRVKRTQAKIQKVSHQALLTTYIYIYIYIYILINNRSLNCHFYCYFKFHDSPKQLNPQTTLDNWLVRVQNLTKLGLTGLQTKIQQRHFHLGKHFVTYRHFCIRFWISRWNLQSKYDNLLFRIIELCRIIIKIHHS